MLPPANPVSAQVTEPVEALETVPTAVVPPSRNTRYVRVVAWSSVDADQVRSTRPATVLVPDGWPGTVGGTVSGGPLDPRRSTV